VCCSHKPKFNAGPAKAAAATLPDRQLDVLAPDWDWASDFTHSRTHEFWMAVVTAPLSRQVIDWAMQAGADSKVVLQSLLSAVWRRKQLQCGPGLRGPGIGLHER
jgi:putative transposase